MKKIIKFFAAVIFMAGMFILAACGGSSGIKGEMSVVAKRDSLEVTCEFEENSKLSDGSTTVSVKLYNADDTYNSTQSVKLDEGAISGTCTFSNLKSETEYTLKLYVSISGIEEEISTLETATKNDGANDGSAISITDVDGLKNMKNDATAYYKLENDIDVNNAALSIFTSSSSAFKGNFDGNNKTIKNIKLSAVQYTGLFGYASSATIKNLTLENVTIEITSSIGNSTVCMGALVGYAENSTIENVTIKNLSFTNKDDKSFSSSSAKAYVGGLGGLIKTSQSLKSEVNNCKVLDSTINLTGVKGGSTTTNKTHLYSGLFAGQIMGSTSVANSSAAGDIEYTLNLYSKVNAGIGGFVGALSSDKKLKSCYADCTIKATKAGSNTNGTISIGGLVGLNPNDGQCNIEDALVIADITVLGGADLEKANTTKFADKLYVGGIIGNLSCRTTGVKNVVYKAKEAGIKLTCKITATSETVDDVVETKYNTMVSNTVNATLSDSTIAEKLQSTYSLADSLSFDITAEVSRKVESDSGESKDEVQAIEDLESVKAAIVSASNIDANAATYLSENLQSVLNPATGE